MTKQNIKRATHKPATSKALPTSSNGCEYGCPQERENPRLEISFQNVSCHGFLSSARSQHTVTTTAAGIQILNDINGLVRGGEMLLVLGRPGSGCSTLLQTLAGDAHGFHIGGDSRFSYEGLSYDQMHSKKLIGECMYLAEPDVHFPELTLGETLRFAADVRSSDHDTAAASKVVVRNVATPFNLEGSLNTKIGDAMIRGLSGGKKRRCSLAEALISGAQFQAWDHSTRDLDSATALSVVVSRCFSVSTRACRSPSQWFSPCQMEENGWDESGS
ncbi:P-loop containing nucleoside triphosphate hydrolase protein [Podospora conica]|nr:P-loop containing nucleoside triphosphate hydrolase protein [Schizothecium conicum]